MTVEKYLGKSKYDGKIRRITLLKSISERLGMEDGDYITYYEVDGEIVIRKEHKTWEENFPLNKMIPKYFTMDDQRILFDMAFAIAGYYVDNHTPSDTEMFEITETLISLLPKNCNKEKKSDFLKSAVDLAKNMFSKTVVCVHNPTGDNDI